MEMKDGGGQFCADEVTVVQLIWWYTAIFDPCINDIGHGSHWPETGDLAWDRTQDQLKIVLFGPGFEPSTY
jgi:hypothetical protein